MSRDDQIVIRTGTAADAQAINRLRLAVRENVLADPTWLTEQVTIDALTTTGRGWIAQESGRLLGFSIARADEASVWALFVHPDHEGRSLGKALLARAVEWLWSQGAERITLSTDPGTRAESFYRRQGWQEEGTSSKGEICFVLHRQEDGDADRPATGTASIGARQIPPSS